jgi:hypothetical protein
MTVLLKLFLAHFIGDFLLQPASWVKAKEGKKIGAWQLYIHALLHGLLILLLMWNWHFWKWALLIAFVHLIIDSLKILLQNNANRRLLFFIDQALHFISVYLIWLWMEDKNFPFLIFENTAFLFLVTSIIFLANPVSFAVKIFISKWTPEYDDTASLQSAGKYIGILERLLVFLFIVINQWAAIGFLLAAKSIFRFGDLKESKDRKLTEYVLIGTLLSFSVAIFIGLLFRFVR